MNTTTENTNEKYLDRGDHATCQECGNTGISITDPELERKFNIVEKKNLCEDCYGKYFW